ncbi:MAG TPA: hypothetical protein VFA67_07520, partial [Candidatus Sulfotelmatobacter sp.]|nr:hypothetical protein [Candidatus Sulfotelmatobacter sp.]
RPGIRGVACTSSANIHLGIYFGRRMNKKLLNRDKRHVARAKEAVKQSEPDVSPLEQLASAPEASPAVKGPRDRCPQYSTPL